MTRPLHITSGDTAGGALEKAGLPGDVFVWHDIFYGGPPRTGWPDDATLQGRARFLEQETGGGLTRTQIITVLRKQYRTLAENAGTRPIVLWFDACLFDQSMLAHLLACLWIRQAREVDLLVVDAFPGITPYHGLGQLSPGQLASRYDQRRPVSDAQFQFAVQADRAFGLPDPALLSHLAQLPHAPLPAIPAAAARWLAEQPDPATGLKRLERLALEAVRAGNRTPTAIFTAVSAADTPPQFWGDTTLWAAVNQLAAQSVVSPQN